MITLPITCRQGLYMLIIVPWIITLPIGLLGDSHLNWIPIMVVASVEGVLGLTVLLCWLSVSIQCKCDK